MGWEKPTARDDESTPAGGGGKSKKNILIAGDEYYIGTELWEEVDDRKKEKKGLKKLEPKDDDEELGDNFIAGEEDEEDEEEASLVKFGGEKKAAAKKSGNNGGFGFGAFDLLEEDEDGIEDKGKDDEDDELGVPAVSFSGKKKPSNSKRNGSSVSLASELHNGEEESGDKYESWKEEDVGITFRRNNLGGGGADDEVASKNKKKKKKGGKNLQEYEEDLNTIFAEFGVQDSAATPVASPKSKNQSKLGEGPAETETSKKKKKKKVKKASAPAVGEKPEDTINSKVTGKKVPKHVREMQEILAKVKEAEERKKREEEEERSRKEEEERLKQEGLERLAEAKEKDMLLKRKREGKLLTGKQKEKARTLEAMRKQLLANTNLDLSMPAKRPLYQKKKSKPQNQSNGAAISDDVETTDSKEIQQDVMKEDKPKHDDHPVQNGQNLRSPICCILGHVDTGKTKLLDCIRGTNVQEGEAGGITQQIGATYFPAENIRERTKELKADATLNVPGLLVIDTPGHESFTNLRFRGSGLCDLAVVIVDIMHGLEPQTVESLSLLKKRNVDFFVALNKVDRLYGWKTCPNAPIVKAIKQQSKDVMIEFNTRLTQIITQFKEQGLNSELYYKNKEMGEIINIVPTSAISGEGIPDLLLLLVQWAQKTMVQRLTYSKEVQCSVLEVKMIEGHGTTIDVVLANGVLQEGDQIVVCGMQGPIVTTTRALLTPHPMRELRVKGKYLHHKEIKAAQVIKIAAQGLEHAIAGTSLYVVGSHDDLEDIKQAAMKDVNTVMSRAGKCVEGVYVQASTLGSLEALLEFLKTPAVNIPVSSISTGPVHKKDVMKASAMLEKRKEYATILAFDVKVTKGAQELANNLGVKIFTADVIYTLSDLFKGHTDKLKAIKKKEAAEEAVFPCILRIIPDCVYNKKEPILLGVDVVEGIAKIGTPICIPRRGFIDIGKIASIKCNHNPVHYAKKGQKVAIEITGSSAKEKHKMFGRDFEMQDKLVSKITRSSFDAINEYYADELSGEDRR